MRKNFNNNQKREFINYLCNTEIESLVDCVENSYIIPPYWAGIEKENFQLDGITYNLTSYDDLIMLYNLIDDEDDCERLLNAISALPQSDAEDAAIYILLYAYRNAYKLSKSKLALSYALTCVRYISVYSDSFERCSYIARYIYEKMNDEKHDTIQYIANMPANPSYFYYDDDIENLNMEISVFPKYFDDAYNLIDIKIDGHSIYYGSQHYAKNFSIKNIKSKYHNWDFPCSFYDVPRHILMHSHIMMKNGELKKIIDKMEDLCNQNGYMKLEINYSDENELFQYFEPKDATQDTQDQEDYFYELEESLRKK